MIVDVRLDEENSEFYSFHQTCSMVFLGSADGVPGKCCRSACTGHRTTHRPGRLVGPWPINSRYVFLAVFLLLIFSFSISNF
jgi:hypothetical protein